MERKAGRFGVKTLVMVAVVFLVAGIAVTARFDITEKTGAQNFWKESSPKEEAAFGPRAFVDLSKRLMPTVVNISTTQVVKEKPLVPFPEFKTPFDEFFGDEFFKPFGGEGHEREFKRQSLGSGFIINKDGYILTNYHVIENATEIIVTLSGHKKKEYKAKVVGKDQMLDVALVKIDDEGDLPVVALGDSDALEIGGWVMAIGNPFGLGGTVTAGIVSQKGRVIGAGPYDNFIQTDASINPGNSGGPLFNLKGEVVGINTAIIAGGQGIGFAVPVNMVKDILVELKEKGKTTRGWIGVTIQEVTSDIASSFGLKEPKGALVSSVVAGDPAEKAGIKAGDIIMEFDGKAIDELGDLPRTVAATAPGKNVEVRVIRDGKEAVLKLKVGKKKDGEEEKAVEEEAGEPAAGEKLGIFVKDLTPEVAERMGIETTEGVLVHSVKRDSPAYDAGIRRGDIIGEINRRPVRNVKEYGAEMKTAAKKDVVLFLVKRGAGTLYVTVKIK
ncbi:MAG: DegQ family serine endoprotease [Deltaproteobacteria bacterium]|nr:DegQ family serine endoprotease [Deltaproteobacteria bacterium]